MVAGEGDFDPKEVSEAAQRLGWPVLAPPPRGSSLRGGHHLSPLAGDGVPDVLRPDLVVTMGRIGPSDRLGSLTSLPVPQVHVDRWGAWNDPRRHSTHLLQADPAQTLAAFSPAPDDRFLRSWLEADATMRSALDEHLSADETLRPAVARPSVPR